MESLTTNADEDHPLMHFSAYLDSQAHKYVTAAICVIGMILNVALMVVLTREAMICPANILMAAISLADNITIALYLILLVVTASSHALAVTYEFAYYKLVCVSTS